MGKRRWTRIRFADLADRETQDRILGYLEAAREGDQAQDSAIRPHEKPVAGRSAGGEG